MQDRYNLNDLPPYKILCDLEVCKKYIDENGGVLYERVSGGKTYQLDSPILPKEPESDVYYVRRETSVNKRGVYAVVLVDMTRCDSCGAKAAWGDYYRLEIDNYVFPCDTCRKINL